MPQRIAAIVLALVATAGCSGTPSQGDAPFEVRLVTPPAERGSEPQLTVSDRGVILSWVEHDGPVTMLKFAERTASGWTAPVTAAAGTGWFVSYADPPSVMRLSNGTLVAQYQQRTHRFTESMNPHLSYSTDNGRRWSPPFTPHHDGTISQHAFGAPFDLPDGGLGLVWLDGRATMIETDDPAGGAMGLRYAAFDANWRQVADQPVDGRVCECCSMATAETTDGILLAFRDRARNEARDISVSRLANGAWTAITPVHADGWITYACPVNGPALSARGRGAVVSWFTVKNDQGQAYAAFSGDSGGSWGAPVRLDDGGSLGRVAVEMLEDGSPRVVWIEFVEGRGQLRARRIDASGTRSARMTLAGLGDGRTSGMPRLARHRHELVFAWTESEAVAGDGEPILRLRTAVASVP